MISFSTHIKIIFSFSLINDVRSPSWHMGVLDIFYQNLTGTTLNLPRRQLRFSDLALFRNSLNVLRYSQKLGSITSHHRAKPPLSQNRMAGRTKDLSHKAKSFIANWVGNMTWISYCLIALIWRKPLYFPSHEWRENSLKPWSLSWPIFDVLSFLPWGSVLWIPIEMMDFDPQIF
jgi:hypothetical protein